MPSNFVFIGGIFKIRLKNSETLKTNKIMKNKIEDHVIKCLSVEHGAEIVQYFKDLGIYTNNTTGEIVDYYYGLFDGNFNLYETPKNSKVIELPKKMYSVQEIKSNPKIAIQVDSQEDWKKLKRCAGGNCVTSSFYGKSFYTLESTWHGHNPNTQDYTIITLNQIKELNMEKEFVLPNNWYLEATDDNLEIGNKWLGNKEKGDFTFIGNNWYDTSNYSLMQEYRVKEYLPSHTKITTEQFIEHVYNPKFNKTMKKELIGYKLIKPEYAQVACEIEGYEKIGESIRDGKTILIKDTIDRTDSFQRLKKAGVLDLWFEKVYKEEFKAGDWVTIIQDVYTKGETFQITEKMLKCVPKDYLSYKNWTYIFPNQVRLATKEEIAKVQEKVYTLGIDEKFEIVVRDKKAFYGGEDVTETLVALQQLYKYGTGDHKVGKYTWNFGDTFVNSVGCIKKQSMVSQWLSIDLT